ncbi:hypothetical protein K1X76_07115 [bacterium]|nr:hypothetical protein [bacterium]
MRQYLFLISFILVSCSQATSSSHNTGITAETGVVIGNPKEIPMMESFLPKREVIDFTSMVDKLSKSLESDSVDKTEKHLKNIKYTLNFINNFFGNFKDQAKMYYSLFEKHNITTISTQLQTITVTPEESGFPQDANLGIKIDPKNNDFVQLTKIEKADNLTTSQYIFDNAESYPLRGAFYFVDPRAMMDVPNRDMLYGYQIIFDVSDPLITKVEGEGYTQFNGKRVFVMIKLQCNQGSSDCTVESYFRYLDDPSQKILASRLYFIGNSNTLCGGVVDDITNWAEKESYEINLDTGTVTPGCAIPNPLLNNGQVLFEDFRDLFKNLYQGQGWDTLSADQIEL